MLMAAVLPPDAALLRNSQLVPMLLAYNEMLVGYIPGRREDSPTSAIATT